MSDFRAERVERSHAFVVELPCEQAFELFTPEGERAWAQGWDPRYLHPADGSTQRGMAFITGSGDELTLWMMLRHDPAGGIVEYQRVTPASRMGTVLVQCTALDARRTRVSVSYELVALNEAGNARLKAWDESAFRAFIVSWDEAIARVVTARNAA